MIGIDVGGANLKVADGQGVHIYYCPLWTGAPFSDLLSPYTAGRDTPAAVVMSGELADCFENKLQGIGFIVRAVQEVFPAARFYGTDAVFHTSPVPALAAANWLASADFLREKYRMQCCSTSAAQPPILSPSRAFLHCGDSRILTAPERVSRVHRYAADTGCDTHFLRGHQRDNNPGQHGIFCYEC